MLAQRDLAAALVVPPRHRPKTTLLHQLVREHVATFYAEVLAHRPAAAGRGRDGRG